MDSEKNIFEVFEINAEEDNLENEIFTIDDILHDREGSIEGDTYLMDDVNEEYCVQDIDDDPTDDENDIFDDIEDVIDDGEEEELEGWRYDEENNIWFPPTFDGDEEGVIGNPNDDMESWHCQTYSDTCAIVSQEFIIEELTGEDVTEDELRMEAIENCWYENGTTLENMGNLLESHGIPVDRHYEGSIEEIEDRLGSGEKVMIAVDSDEIWSPGGNYIEDEILGDSGTYPGSDANHAVQVIGIDKTEPDNPIVILNDPGHPGGAGIMVRMDEFMSAWEDSGCYMVSTNYFQTI